VVTGEEANFLQIDENGNSIDNSKEPVYKIEVPANRYDLLCNEGFCQAIKSYLSMG